MNTEIKESLIIGEFGDVRSMLDELDLNGTTSIDELRSGPLFSDMTLSD